MKTNIVRTSTRMATEEDAHLPTFDNTKLVAINTCPTWGIVRYVMHKTTSNGRAMALEAGGACHDVFAALRLYQLAYHDPDNEISPLYGMRERAMELFMFHGERLFPDGRFDLMYQAFDGDEDENVKMLNFCLRALETSGFHDDPRDKRRTMTNLEEACIAYMDRWQFDHPIWVRDANDPKSDVGIEVPFDVVVEFEYTTGELNDNEEDLAEGMGMDPSAFLVHEKKSIRFTGKLDGLHLQKDRDGEVILRVGENKTASRIDDAWQESFEMASQITGYNVAASTWTQQPVFKAYVHGLAIPLPKSYDYGGVIRITVRRTEDQIKRWFAWVLHTVLLCEEFQDNVIEAPQYTHSCNRYFRACSLIPFCSSEQEIRPEFLQEMNDDEWSPLHD